MFKAIGTLGSSLLKGFNQPSILNKQTYGYFSSWLNYSPKSLVQYATSSSTMLGKNSSSSDQKTFLQANSNNLCFSRGLITAGVIKFSLKTGKKKSRGDVLKRFYRLNCGLWIHRRAGSHKRLWKKNWSYKYGVQQHVFCDKNQNIVCDLMTSPYWKKKKYYIDDPFEPYHERHNFDWVLPKRQRN